MEVFQKYAEEGDWGAYLNEVFILEDKNSRILNITVEKTFEMSVQRSKIKIVLKNCLKNYFFLHFLKLFKDPGSINQVTNPKISLQTPKSC